MRLFFLRSLTILLCLAPLASQAMPQESQELIVSNRILARVNGKTISVLDVMKKMDIFLQRNYPEALTSHAARYQFYSTQWKDTLSQIINQELILSDAEHLGVKVSEADVREEIMARFGPNVMASLDQIDLSLEEAKDLLHTELTVQQMMWYRVHAKALVKVKPQDIRKAYREYCEKNPPLEEWKYEVLALRTKQKAIGEKVAHKAFELLQHSGKTLASTAEELRSTTSEEESVTVSLLEDLEASDKSIAKAHKDILQTLNVGAYSQPIAQVSRADGSLVHRIFHLKEHTSRPQPSFRQLSEKLKNSLFDDAASEENTAYIAKLRSKMGYDEKQILEPLPEGFQPFSLQ